MLPEINALSRVLEKEIAGLEFGEITAVLRIQSGQVVFTEIHNAQKFKNHELMKEAELTGISFEKNPQ